MKSIEFLTEAEANLAQKKLDKYLDMLSNEHLRELIPMLKKEVHLDEAQYPEASKVQSTIRSLSDKEKKELLSVLQKEAKTRPSSSNKSPKKSSGGMKGCLLPLVGIIGIITAPAAIEYSGTDIKGYADQPVKPSRDPSVLTALSGEYLDHAKSRFCNIKQGWSKQDVLKYMSSGEIDFNDMFLEKELLRPDTEVWNYGYGNQIGTLYIDRDSGRVTSIIYGDISPDDCK